MCYFDCFGISESNHLYLSIKREDRHPHPFDLERGGVVFEQETTQPNAETDPPTPEPPVQDDADADDDEKPTENPEEESAAEFRKKLGDFEKLADLSCEREDEMLKEMESRL